ncbi:regulatory protein RecX, partial [uncultured Selenomonas sp.]
MNGTGDAPKKRGRKSQAKTALVTAVDYLARQAHSEKKLREKLERKGFPEEEIDAAIARLIERGYLDDSDLCAQQFMYLYNEKRNSVRQICAKLIQRGFNHDLVWSVVPEDTFEREIATAERVLAMKYQPTDNRQKMMANLYQKGFSVDAARHAVEN